MQVETTSTCKKRHQHHHGVICLHGRETSIQSIPIEVVLLIREFAMQSPVGRKIPIANGTYVEIIGIVKDFHIRSLHEKIEPLVFAWSHAPMLIAHIKVAPSDVSSTLKIIEAEWQTVGGQRVFNYQFLDESFDKQYKGDEQLATIIGYFTALAIIIACLGLFAMSSFMVSRRTKEIGIRKTLGASTGAIYFMLSWNFLKWILVALVIAVPVAWYLMHLWLETFAYHINIELDIFIIATLLTVGSLF